VWWAVRILSGPPRSHPLDEISWLLPNGPELAGSAARVPVSAETMLMFDLRRKAFTTGLTLYSAMRTSLRWWSSDEFEDGVAHAWQNRLGRVAR
jgi:hypothetical protein